MNNDDRPEHPSESATTAGLTISPALDLVAEAAQVPAEPALIDGRMLRLSAVAIVLGLCGAVASVVLIRLIALVTNLSFYQRFSLENVPPAGNHLGGWVVAVPVVGALIVGFMARYGSKAIRGHGIPEAMEQVLANQSRIPAKLTFLKPLSAAISIGTGGPFGAEGPIIATGGALGSFVGQILSVSAAERKTLLAAGAAAGMAATFGCPIAAVLLAVELLLFEYRARSIVPVALAAATATCLRYAIDGNSLPAFPMPGIAAPTLSALAFYAVLGCLMGVLAAVVTRLVYFIEDAFERLPIHWMWWPALGAVMVGVVGYFCPNTLGVGYYNITAILSGSLATQAVLVLCLLKFVSWSVSLGSGTSGGTMAPLFTIGGGMGAVCGAGALWLLPHCGVDVRVAALVGMAAIFAGASRAMLASAVMAFEVTQQPLGLLPLLAGCTMAYVVSCLLMRNSIMTEKIARRGIRTPTDYIADALEGILVRDIATKALVMLRADDSIDKLQQWIAAGAEGSSHQGFPVLDASGVLVGVLTRRDILGPTTPEQSRIADLIGRSPKFVYDDCTVRQAADHMANHRIGRLPVVSRAKPTEVVGMVTRSDILGCYRRAADEHRRMPATIGLPLRRSATPLG
ncbi:MAG: chloride channel protein [Planctomycetia bacterium]|nr:chloride channel protein [Planctomycetia bacterium]